MRDMMGMMKQAKELQAKMKAMQDEIARWEALGLFGRWPGDGHAFRQGHPVGAEDRPASLMKEDEAEILKTLSSPPITTPRRSSKPPWPRRRNR